MEAGFFRVSIQAMNKRSGSSLAAMWCYRAGVAGIDPETGKKIDYSNRSGVEAFFIALPNSACEALKNPQILWPEALKSASRVNARYGKEIVHSFPAQLTAAGRLELFEEFIAEHITSRGLICAAALHLPDRTADSRAFHGHLMVLDRPIAPETGFFARKKDRGFLETPNQVIEYRRAWAEAANRALSKSGSEVRVDPRSVAVRRAEAEKLAEEAVDEIQRAEAAALAMSLHYTPEPKMGSAVTALLRKKKETAIGPIARAVLSMRERRKTLHEEAVAWLQGVRARILNTSRSIFVALSQATQPATSFSERLAGLRGALGLTPSPDLAAMKLASDHRTSIGAKQISGPDELDKTLSPKTGM